MDWPKSTTTQLKATGMSSLLLSLDAFSLGKAVMAYVTMCMTFTIYAF